MKIRNVAHRGLWNAAVPQNTLEAFRAAWAAGATWVETDFHRTAAGQMLCIHGEGELLAYTGRSDAIASLSREDAASIRLDPVRFSSRSKGAIPPAPAGVEPPAPGESPFRIPLLEEVLATVPKHGTLQSEIKGYAPDYPDVFDAAVRAAGLSEENVVVSSFDFAALADFRARKPSYRTLLLVGVPKDSETDLIPKIAAAKEAGFDWFCPGLTDGDRAPTAAELDAVRASGMGLRVYGVNTPEALRTAARIGAEAFACNFWRDAFDWAKEVPGLELLA